MAGFCACITDIVWIAKPGISQCRVIKRHGKVRRRTAIYPEHYFILRVIAHLGKACQNILLYGMTDFKIGIERQAAHFCMSQHAGMFTRAVITIGRGGFTVRDQGLVGDGIAGHVDAAL